MLLIPSLRVSAITASSHVSFELDSMALMISLLKTVLTNYACRVFLAVKASPSYIARFHLLGADAHRSDI